MGMMEFCSPVIRRSHAAGSAPLGGHEATDACVATRRGRCTRLAESPLEHERRSLSGRYRTQPVHPFHCRTAKLFHRDARTFARLTHATGESITFRATAVSGLQRVPRCGERRLT